MMQTTGFGTPWSCSSGNRRMLMLIHHLSRGSAEQPTACCHLPQRHAQRVEIRTDVDAHSCKLFGTGEFRRPGKAPDFEIEF